MKKMFTIVFLISNMTYGHKTSSTDLQKECDLQIEEIDDTRINFNISHQHQFPPTLYPGILDSNFDDDLEYLEFTRDLSATSNFSNMVKDLNGKLVVCGSGNNSGQSSWVVARYTSDGVLDTTFGNPATPGYYQEDGTHGSFNLGVSIASGLAIDPGGNILVCGTSLISSIQTWTVISYTPSGTSHSVDTGFSGFTGGVTPGIIQEKQFGSSRALSISLSSTNPYIIYVGGFTTSLSAAVFTTISYLTNGSRNSAYNA